MRLEILAITLLSLTSTGLIGLIGYIINKRFNIEVGALELKEKELEQTRKFYADKVCKLEEQFKRFKFNKQIEGIKMEERFNRLEKIWKIRINNVRLEKKGIDIEKN